MKTKTRSNSLLGKSLFVVFFLFLLTFKGVAQSCPGLSFTYTTTESTCVSNGTITISVSGGSSSINYIVEGPFEAPIDPVTTTVNVITGRPAGTYKVTVQDVGNGGCTVEQSNVVVPGSWTSQSFSFNNTEPGCSNADGIIRVSGRSGGRAPFKYTIMPLSVSGEGTTNATGIFTNLVPGEYFIQSEDACNNLLTLRTVLLDFSWGIDNIAISRSVCDSADAIVTLLDNKGNTSTSGSIFSGYVYGVVNTPGDTTWFTTPSFRFRVGKKLSGELVVRDPCKNLITRPWFVPALQIPSLGPVATSNYRCDSTFTASITGPLALITPNYCIYNSSNVLLGCNTTGVFTNLSYGKYSIRMTDGCYDTVITREFTSAPPKPSVAATVVQSNQTCTTFTATVTGKVNISGATYCLVKDDGSKDTLDCNATGVFNNVPYGNYCINIKNDPYCYDTTITRCFSATLPLPVVNAVRMTSQGCNSVMVDTLQGHTNAPATRYCLYDENGDEIACNSTGIFDNVSHGNYCIRSLSECGVWSASYCFNTKSNTPTVGNNVVRTNRTCKTFTAYISDTSRLVKPLYCLYDNNNNLIRCDSSGIFNNLPYGSYCITIKNDPSCYDILFTRCFTETKPPATITATLTQSNTTCTAFTATISGTGLTTPLFILLNTHNDTVGKNTTGIFPNMPYGAYCGVIIDGCDDTLKVCQTFEPLRGITLSSWISCKAGNATVAAQMTSRNNPYNFYFYHPDGRLLHSVIGTWSNWQSTELPGLPAGAQYKVVGVDNCGRKDSAYVTPQASELLKNISIRQRCPSGKWAAGSGDLTITSYSPTFGTVTPRLIKKDGVVFNQTYTTRSGQIYNFLDLGPATYVVEYYVNQCGTTLHDTVVINPYTNPGLASSAIYQCDNGSFSVNAVVANGAGPFTYAIIASDPATPSIITPPQSSPSFIIDNANAYSLIRIQAVDVCNISAEIEPTVHPLGHLIITRTSNCLHSASTLSVNAIAGATYSWYKKTSEVDSVLIGTGRTYTIPYLVESDMATYVCKTTVNSTCLTRLSYITMTGDCGGTVLSVPIQLAGKKTAKGNQLTWNIEGDMGTTYTVERKGNAEANYRAIAIGNYAPAGTNKLSFIDEKLISGSNLYRIKKVTASGTVEYSNTLKMVNTSLHIDMFPNPVRESFTIEINNEVISNYNVALYTIDGRMLFQKQLNGIKKATNTYSKPAGTQSGTYVLRITDLYTGEVENRMLLFQ
jgi:hypothetical protein